MLDKKITLIGAGLAGPLMANYLAKKGFFVEIYERRSDMRKIELSAGRSINLALSARGIMALKGIGIFDNIKPFIIPMSGRMIHDKSGETNFQSYGQRNSEVIYSISRSKLNMELMNFAEETGSISIYFNHKLLKANIDKRELIFEKKVVSFNRVFGCDGSGSVLRNAIVNKTKTKFVQKPLGHGYKELSMPASKHNEYQIDYNALHIWPRGNFMMIALPNIDKTFTVTIFMPLKGEISFDTIKTEKQIEDFFTINFMDALKLMPNLLEDFKKNPIGSLASNYCDQWHYKDKAVIFGDAAHAVVPFFGQGMNASFQDCIVLNKLINKYGKNWGKIFNSFSSQHVKNGHAIANMALENYVEMRDSVNDSSYLERRELELDLEKKFPNKFIPRYSMVSFHQIPYEQVYKRGEVQFKLMSDFLSKKITLRDLYKNIENFLEPIS